MKLSPLFLAVRAVSAEFARRLFVPVVWIASALLIVLIGISIWLVTISAWWWFLLAPLILVGLLFIVIAIVAWLAITLLRPQQTKVQRRQVTTFVTTLQKTSEAVQTPKFIILFRLVKDMVFPSEHGFVRELSDNATSLRSSFMSIVASF